MIPVPAVQHRLDYPPGHPTDQVERAGGVVGLPAGHAGLLVDPSALAVTTILEYHVAGVPAGNFLITPSL